MPGLTIVESKAMLISFPYINRDTPIHRLDPRGKLILLFLFGLAAAQTSNFWFILVGFIFAAFYYSLAQLIWSETKRAWYFIIALNIMIVVFNYFLSAGSVVQGVDLTHQHVLYKMPFIGVTGKPPFFAPTPLLFSVESIIFMITQGMRNFGIALLAVPIPYTTNPGHIGIAFKGMGL